jgi:hypothetical protein
MRVSASKKFAVKKFYSLNPGSLVSGNLYHPFSLLKKLGHEAKPRATGIILTKTE